MKKITLLAGIALLNLPLITFAAEPNVYKPLVTIPGIDANSNFDGYINSLYALSITIAALLAVIKIIIAGVKWMMTDIVTSKSEAKKDIQGALIGLLIVLSAVLILNVINPKITTVDLSFKTISAPTNTNSNTPPPTLDTSKISTSNPVAGVTMKYMPASAGAQQLQLFRNSCPQVLSGSNYQATYNTPSGTSCISWPSGKKITQYDSNYIAQAASICTNQKGELFESPDHKQIYCLQ